jgi:cobalamin biosynthesis Mg chelatase CobN
MGSALSTPTNQKKSQPKAALTGDKLKDNVNKVMQLNKIAPEQVAAAQAAISQADITKNAAEKAAAQVAYAQTAAKIANAQAAAAKEAATQVTERIVAGQKITMDAVDEVISKATNQAAQLVISAQSSQAPRSSQQSSQAPRSSQQSSQAPRSSQQSSQAPRSSQSPQSSQPAVYNRDPLELPVNNMCPTSTESVTLCYPVCKDGYKGSGNTCVKSVKESFTNIGTSSLNNNIKYIIIFIIIILILNYFKFIKLDK